MIEKVFHIVLTLVLVAAFGCATTSVPGGDGASPDDLAGAVVEKLTRAYENRDVSGFMALVSARYLEGYGDLQTALEDVLDTTVSVDLTIMPERVWEQTDGTLLMDAGWNKTVMRSDVPGIQSTSGRVTFIFIRYDNDVLKLLSQKGSPVFP